MKKTLTTVKYYALVGLDSAAWVSSDVCRSNAIRFTDSCLIPQAACSHDRGLDRANRGRMCARRPVRLPAARTFAKNPR